VINARGFYRLLVFIIVTSVDISKILFLGVVKGKNEERAIHLRRKLAIKLVKLMNICCEVSGYIPEKGTLCVTNHRSYIDSICIFQYLDACPVVKAEVRKWPIIGYGLVHTGTVFVDRKSKASRKKTREQIVSFINRGISTIVFVEGTTYVGPEAGEFRPGTFMVAAEGGLSIVPIAIEFEHQDAAWVGADSFIPHFLEFFGKYKEIRVKVSFGPALTNSNWQQLKTDSYNWVNNRLLEMRAEFDEER